LKSENDKKHVDVVAAVIFEGRSVYCFKKGEGKFQYLSHKFEFPGGKVECNEDKQSALLREIKEELDVDITIGEEMLTVSHEYPDFSLTMTCFRCKANEPNFTLTEHKEVRLVEVEKLLELEWLAADLPVVEKLMGLYDA
jgi:8-oxo-dGTP diphosphatase